MRELLIEALVVAALAFVVRSNLWRAVLFVWPASMRIEPEAPPDAEVLPESLKAADAQLRALGFTSVGTHTEKPLLRRELKSFDYAHAQEGAFATLYQGLSQQPRLYFLTPCASGFVLTASYRRPAHEEKGRYLAGSLEHLSLERVLKAHLRRVPEVGPPSAQWTQDGRLAAARAWFSGPGKRELRQQNAMGLLWTLGSIGLFFAALFGKR